MFCGASGDDHRHYRASAYLDSRIYPSPTASIMIHLREAVGPLNTVSLWRMIDRLPDGWKTKSALERFSECLEMLTTAEIVHCVVEVVSAVV